MTNVWDNFTAGGAYAEFNNVGDTVEGVIKNISAKQWSDGKISPQLELRQADGSDITLTAGWTMLVKELKAKAPSIGDWIKVTMIAVGPKPKEMREWNVEVAATIPTPAAAAAPAAPATAPTPPAPAAATANPLDKLSPEEKAALGIVDTPAVTEDPRLAVWRAAGLNDAQITTLLAA